MKRLRPWPKDKKRTASSRTQLSEWWHLFIVTQTATAQLHGPPAQAG